MNTTPRHHLGKAVLLAVSVLLLAATGAMARIDGEAGTTFSMVAEPIHVIGGDGNIIFNYGIGMNGKAPQYPAPTLILQQNAQITVTLTNHLDVPISLTFPGHAVTATGGMPGLLAQEAEPGGTVTYTFTADHPGTFMYQSGTDPAIQIELGVIGAIIVRPTGFDPTDEATFTAYGNPESAYGHEILYVHTEMDHNLHQAIQFHQPASADNSKWFAYYWFYNGRNWPDVIAPVGTAVLPNQPYDCVPRMHVGDTMLIRIVGGGRQLHPFHHHGNSGVIVGRDGRYTPLHEGHYTETVVPGQTMDVLFDQWTGQDLGWDIHGHQFGAANATIMPLEAFGNATLDADIGAPANTLTLSNTDGFPPHTLFRAILWNPASGGLDNDPQREIVTLRRMSPNTGSRQFYIIRRGLEGTQAQGWAAGTVVTGTYHARGFSHGSTTSALPTQLPALNDLTYGELYSGSPFLGASGQLPIGANTLNLNNGITYMWHSHSEKELTTNDIWPGGAISMLIIEPENVVIPHSPN